MNICLLFVNGDFFEEWLKNFWLINASVTQVKSKVLEQKYAAG